MPGLADAKPLSEAVVSANKSFLFYGPPGTWKTTLAAYHPGKRKLWLDIDDKLAEMEHLPPDVQSTITAWSPCEALVPDTVMVSNIDRTRRDVTKGAKILQKPMGYWKTTDVVNELLRLAKSGTFPYDLVVLDSLTRLMNHLEYLVMFQHDTTLLNETLYGVIKRNIEDFIFGFLRLPCDRIVITHDRHKTKRDREGAIIEDTIRPNVTGQMSEYLVGYFSEAYYFLGSNDQGKTWRIQTGADSMKPARTTKPLKFEQVIDPVQIFGTSPKSTTT